MQESTRERFERIEALTPGGAPVHVITEELTWAEVEGLHHRGDCYFSLTHGERFGLGTFDAAAAGKHAITTGWGAVLDYLDPAQKGLVDWDPVPAWNRDGTGNWDRPRPAHAGTVLKPFRADPESTRRRVARAQSGLHERFGTTSLIPFLKKLLANE